MSSKNELWRSPLGSPYLMGAFLLVLVGTIAKFSTNGIWVCECSRSDQKEYDVIDLVLYAGWIVGPPVFFMFEYMIVMPARLRMNSDQRDDIKYVHELAGKVWAAVGLMLGLLLYVKYGFAFR